MLQKFPPLVPGYLEELRYEANGLEKLFEYERGKCYGILNGIDSDVWDPAAGYLYRREIWNRRFR